MRKTLLLGLILCCSLHTANGQTLEGHHNTEKEGYNFWVYTPPVRHDSCDSDGKQPLILFLHGQSLCGKNLEKVRRYGPLHALSMGREIASMILAPQNPGGAWNAKKIKRVLDWTVEHYPVDTNRIYVFGMSLGGYGTLDFVGTYPEIVAAAIAMCSGSQLGNLCGLNEVPLWIVHGTADRDVPLSQSQRIVDAMKRCGDTSRLVFTTPEGITHGGLARAFYRKEPYEWLLTHRRDTPGRPVNRNCDITPADLQHAYSDLHRKGATVKVVNDKDEEAEPDTSANAHGDTYTVKHGDTLNRIAKSHGTTVEKLCQLNGLTQESILHIGRKIKLR